MGEKGERREGDERVRRDRDMVGEKGPVNQPKKAPDLFNNTPCNHPKPQTRLTNQKKAINQPKGPPTNQKDRQPAKRTANQPKRTAN